jgi:uncharacterized protein YndB with AHSA1/START domain
MAAPWQDEHGASATVVVRRQIAAPPDRVFAAWLDPAQLGQWMFAPGLRDEEVLRLACDPRPGGRFSFLVRRGGQEIDHVGEYLALEPSHRLVFTWGVAPAPPESRVTVEIAPRDGGSELVLTHAMHPKWAAMAERSAGGWRLMLEALARRHVAPG